MSPARSGELITFYSYKGGVGRSAAVANVGTLLAQQGKKVLLIDFDLEAPGLHRYFVTDVAQRAASAPVSAPAGTIEFFELLEARFDHLLSGKAFDQGSGEPSAPDQASLRAAIAELLDGGQFVQKVTVDNPNRETSQTSLDLMRAGRFDPEYPERVRRFAWQEFYEKYPFFVDLLSSEIGNRYDYALIDSRTGTTDVGNLCTVLLPEKLVLVFTPNEQSLHGAAEVGLQAVELRKASQDLRALPLFPLMSRVENAENELQRRWIAQAKTRFEQVFRTAYGVEKSLSLYFDAVQIPHKSFYAYGESIAAARERVSEAHSLASAFRDFSEVLGCNSAVDAQALMSKSAHGRFTSDEYRNPSVERPSSEPEPAMGYAPRGNTSSIPAVDTAALQPGALRSAWRLALLVAAALGLLFLLGFGLWSVKSGGRMLAVGDAPPSVPSSSAVFLNVTAATPEAESSAMVVPPATGVAESRPPAPTGTSMNSKGHPLRPELNPRTVPPSLPASLDQALATTLTIKASATPVVGVRNASGKQTYHFNVWIDGPHDATDRIASVDYFFDHPSFATKHFTSNADPDFLQGYKGWGCLNTIVVTIRWKSGSQSPLPFNQCAALAEVAPE